VDIHSHGFLAVGELVPRIGTDILIIFDLINPF
jgi:hypothetical protein